MTDDSNWGLPEIDRLDLLDALEIFDREHRGNGRWEDWQSNQNHKYAIKHEGRLYPVKQVVSLATGLSNRAFSGGDEANSYVRNYGLDVVRLREEENVISEALGEILDTYIEVRTSEPFGKTDEEGNTKHVWVLFEKIENALEESAALSQRPHVQIQWSVGLGNWARIPWIAFLDDRETSSTQEGVYGVCLFREDMSGVYLTYGLGVTRPTEQYGQKVGQALIQNRVERLRRRSGELKEHGFSLDCEIDLATDGRVGQEYEDSTVAYKLYRPDALPTDDELLSDLDAVLQTYDRYVSRRQQRRAVSLDHAQLKSATDHIIRPALIGRGDLKEDGWEGYHHHKVIPEATVKLTPSQLASRPIEAVKEAIGASKTLLSQYDKMPARALLEITDPEEVQAHVSELLYGAEISTIMIRQSLTKNRE